MPGPRRTTPRFDRPTVRKIVAQSGLGPCIRRALDPFPSPKLPGSALICRFCNRVVPRSSLSSGSNGWFLFFEVATSLSPAACAPIGLVPQLLRAGLLTNPLLTLSAVHTYSVNQSHDDLGRTVSVLPSLPPTARRLLYRSRQGHRLAPLPSLPGASWEWAPSQLNRTGNGRRKDHWQRSFAQALGQPPSCGVRRK
jgi:hypothetical protein